MRANLDRTATEEAHELLGTQLEELGARSDRRWTNDALKDAAKPALPNDFTYSPAALYTFHGSGGAWIGGAVYILSTLIGL